MARPSTKKPATRRAPAAPKVKAAAPKAEGASKAVEWPVGAAKVKSNPVTPPQTLAAQAVKVQAPKAAAPKPVKAAPVAKAEPVKAEPVKAAEAKPAPVEAKPVEAKLAADVKSADAKPVVEASIVPPETPAAPEHSPATVPAAQTKGRLIMTDAMETAKTYAEETKARIQSAVADMNEKAKVAMEKSAKAFEEIGDLTKGNLEALVESSKIATKGVEALSQEAAEYGRKSFEKTSSTFKSFASVKSPTEFFQLQSELLSATLDSFASEAAKSSEALLKLAGDVTQPLSNRVAIVTEKMKALAA